MAEVSIQARDGGWLTAFMYIDSGADISLIPRQFGEVLGLTVKGEKIHEIKGLGEKIVPVILKKLKMKIDEKTLAARVAWGLIEEVPLILGRLDVFDSFKVTFNQKNEVVEFESY